MKTQTTISLVNARPCFDVKVALTCVAGVDHEEAAGKWRAGDATKSLRFFYRAIEVYNQGLSKFPRNLDLAYNK